MQNQEDKRREKAFKSMLMFGIFSIVMLFAGLTSAYIVSKGALSSEQKWNFISLPNIFIYSTIVIVLSSFFASLAFKNVKKNKFKTTKRYLIIALVLGLFFSILQIQGWSELVSEGHYFAGKDSNVAASYIYVLTGVHLVHLIAGLIVFGVFLLLLYTNNYESKSHIGFKLGMWFWHFLGILWIYLYGFLLYSTNSSDPKNDSNSITNYSVESQYSYSSSKYLNY